MQHPISTRKQESFLRLLREIRINAGLRQVDVGKSLGLPQSFVSKYESGERRLDLLELESVCKACGMNLDEFVSLYLAQK